MALDFPASPSNGDNYVAPNGVTYVYDSVNGYWYVTPTGAVETADIADGAVTTAKLADDAVTGGKLANDITISTTGDLTANSLTLPTAPAVGYQQGVWTPTSPSSGAVTGIRCYWTRVGNLVNFTGLLNNFTNRTSNNQLRIHGLPYDAVSGYNNVLGPVMTQYAPLNLTAYLNSVNDILFYQSSTASWGSIDHVDLTNSASSIHMNGFYITDDTTWTPINNATVS